MDVGSRFCARVRVREAFAVCYHLSGFTTGRGLPLPKGDAQALLKCDLRGDI